MITRVQIVPGGAGGMGASVHPLLFRESSASRGAGNVRAQPSVGGASRARRDYSPDRAEHSDIWVRRIGCFPGLCGRPRDFVSLDDQLGNLPFVMRKNGFGVAVRQGSAAERDLRDAFWALRQYAGNPQSIRAVIRKGEDAAAWRAILCLIRYGLFDIRSRVNLPLPEGAPQASMLGGNQATLIHALAALGTEPARGEGDTVSLEQRFEDLKQANVNLQLKDGRGRTPLHYAALNNNRRALKSLVKAEVQAVCFDNDGETPLSSAIKFGSLNCISSLVEAGLGAVGKVYRGPSAQSDIHVYRDRDPEGAIIRVQVERVKRQSKEHEWSALHWAASLVNPGARDALVVLVASMKRVCSPGRLKELLNEQTQSSGATPLQIAIRARDPDKVKALLEAGANPNLMSRDNKHPMHVAAAWGHPDVMARMIKYGGDPRCVEMVRKSDADPFHSENRHSGEPKESKHSPSGAVEFYPFDTAVRFGNQECARVMLLANEEVSLSRLASVARAGMVELLAEMLHRSGGDAVRLANQPDQLGRSLIHHAAFCNNPDMVTYLVKKMRARLDVPDVRGRYPSAVAERLGVWRRLQELGAPRCEWRNTPPVCGN